MPKATIKNKRTKILIILVPLVFIVSILSYYQLLYKSKRVNNGIVKQVTIFKAHNAQVRGVRFSPDGERLASGSVDSTVMIWNKISGEVIRILNHPQGVTYLEFSPDGNYILTSSYDANIRLWRVIDGELIKEFRGHQKTVWSVAFSPDGKTLASAGDEATIKLWDLASGKLTRELQGHKRTVWSVKFSPDGNSIASASFDASVKIWSVKDGKLLQNITGHSEAVVDIAFSHHGKMLASTSDDKTIKLWNMPDGKLIRTLDIAEHAQAAAFSPDDTYLVTAGRDKPMIGEFLQEIFGDSEYNKGVSMRLWKVESGELLQTFTEHSNDVNDVDISKDGSWIASASEDYTVMVWQFEKSAE